MGVGVSVANNDSVFSGGGDLTVRSHLMDLMKRQGAELPLKVKALTL